MTDTTPSPAVQAFLRAYKSFTCARDELSGVTYGQLTLLRSCYIQAWYALSNREQVANSSKCPSGCQFKPAEAESPPPAKQEPTPDPEVAKLREQLDLAECRFQGAEVVIKTLTAERDAAVKRAEVAEDRIASLEDRIADLCNASGAQVTVRFDWGDIEDRFAKLGINLEGVLK